MKLTFELFHPFYSSTSTTLRLTEIGHIIWTRFNIKALNLPADDTAIGKFDITLVPASSHQSSTVMIYLSSTRSFIIFQVHLSRENDLIWLPKNAANRFKKKHHLKNGKLYFFRTTKIQRRKDESGRDEEKTEDI